MPQSVLAVPVSEAEPIAGEYRRRYDPSERFGAPAHITLVTPFVPPDQLGANVIRELGVVLCGHAPFAFSLADTRTFPDGTLYLAPEPSEPFKRLTESIVDRWPEFPPYGGAFPEIVPHLTLAHAVDHETSARIARAIEPNLPLRTWADEVVVLVGENAGAGWRIVGRLELGRR